MGVVMLMLRFRGTKDRFKSLDCTDENIMVGSLKIMTLVRLKFC